MPERRGPTTTGESDRVDEVLSAVRDLIKVLGSQAHSTAAGGRVAVEQRQALFAYQWIAGHLGRSDVVPPVVVGERRTSTLLLRTDRSGATHAMVVGEDGTIEEVDIVDEPERAVPLKIADEVPISFVELRDEEGALVAVIPRMAAL